MVEPSEKLKSLRGSEALLMKLAWDVVGYERLSKQAREFNDELNMMVDDLRLGLCNTVLAQLRKSQKEILQYYKALYTKKRCPASHLHDF